MKTLFRFIFVCSLAGAFQLPATQAETSTGKLVLGIVSISANEANNQRFIQAATKEGATKGWDGSVIDAARHGRPSKRRHSRSGSTPGRRDNRYELSRAVTVHR